MTVPVFPTLAGAGFPTRESIWSSQEEIAFSGASHAFSNWSYPRYRFTVPVEFLGSGLIGSLNNTDWQTLSGFFDSVKASAGQLFQFHFPDDGAVTTQAFGTGNGAWTQFQLLRTIGGSTVPVYAASSTPSPPEIYVDEVLQVTPDDYSINAYGVVTFVNPPVAAAPITWTGFYNWYCRFDDDVLSVEQLFYRAYAVKGIKFTSVKFGTA